MEKEDVISLYHLLQENGIEVWIDGGWGIDALLDKQTRPHSDLDIAIDHKDKLKLRKLLEERGYKDVDRDDTSDWNFVLSDGEREVDVHTFVFDDNGDNIYGTAYPKESLTGNGNIHGEPVKCISPEWVIRFHAEATYEPQAKDIQDVNAICEKFDLEPPENYKDYSRNTTYLFISGIPASGKSSLAKKTAKKTRAFHLDIDALRREMAKNPKLEPWANFYWNQDERKYLTGTPCKEQWSNLVRQSEAFWPTILEKIGEVKKFHKIAIFEGVNILPHLAHKDLDFSGIVLLGESMEQIFKRNKKAPRWGKTEELQRLEAEIFFNCERENYKREAEKYGFKTFTSSEEAEKELLRLFKAE